MHDVKIDEEGIAAFFDAKAAGIAPPGSPGELPAAAAPAPNPSEAWFPVTRAAAAVVATKVCPAWGISGDLQEQMAEALAECLDQLMPGGLGNIDAWGPWGKLAYVACLWIIAGWDWEANTLKPRHHPDPDDAPPAIDPPGGFKTDA